MFYEYIIGLFIVSSLLMAWFDTPLMVHILHIFRRLGWRKDSDWWDPIPEYTTTKEDLDSYLSLYGKYPLIDDLLSCPICFSFHLALWVSIISFFICDTTITFALGQTLSYPILANIIIRIKDKL